MILNFIYDILQFVSDSFLNLNIKASQVINNYHYMNNNKLVLGRIIFDNTVKIF